MKKVHKTYKNKKKGRNIMNLKLVIVISSVLSFIFWYIYKFIMDLQGFLDVFSHFFGAIAIAILIYYIVEYKKLTFNHSNYILTGTLILIAFWEVIEIIYCYYNNGTLYKSWEPWYLITHDFTIADFFKDISSGILGLFVCLRFII